MKNLKLNSLIAVTVILAATIYGCQKNDTVSSTNSAGLSGDMSFRSLAATAAFAVASSDGFARGTTGGAGGTSTTVTTASALIAAAQASTAQIITVNGSLDLGSSILHVTANKTIIGASSSSSIKGNISVSNTSNVIIQNLTISNPLGIGSGDGIEISGSTKVFVTHCSVFDSHDGNLDVVRASDNVTVSWCKFYYVTQTTHLLCNLIGNGDSVYTDRGKLHVTMHHNWYSTGVNERMPRVRFGYVHCYNNYYGSNAQSYCVGVGNESHILLENNCFENQRNIWVDSRNLTSVAYQLTWTSGNVYINTPIPTWAVNTATPFSRPYTYTMHTGSSIKTIVTLQAGNK